MNIGSRLCAHRALGQVEGVHMVLGLRLFGRWQCLAPVLKGEVIQTALHSACRAREQNPALLFAAHKKSEGGGQHRLELARVYILASF